MSTAATRTATAGDRSGRSGRADRGDLPSAAGTWALTRTALRLVRPLAAGLLLVAIVLAGVLVHRYLSWSDAERLRARVGGYAYHWEYLSHGANAMNDALLQDGGRISFWPAMFAAVVAALMTGREWQSGRTALTLGQSVTPQRWFTIRWAVLAGLFAVLFTPVVALYQANAAHARHLDLLAYGWSRSVAYYSLGPVTVAYVLLGVAAGALAGTVLRDPLRAAVGAPALTWLLAALLVRSRAAALLDFPVLAETHGIHPGGILGLQFYGALPQDTYLLNSLRPGDYWPYQLASTALVLALTALLGHTALRVLRRRTGHS
ncbi:hypothetical protein [Phaeacidiphilus oryzae]|uniref:hypothetical protein n=1 Tax=Phaeacidiphilus oryzae TaxID=348818 RepID=UPI00056C2114|nr:hypothetical protein [Phaeacidiphilus oryzae]